jgi:predicted nucleic acid-binding protein
VIVIDSSAFLAASMPDELDPRATEIIQEVQNQGAYVPAHFFIEVTNSLITNMRRGRIDFAERDLILSALFALPITTDSDNLELTIQATVSLSEQFGLTAYDAAYLELAQRQALKLATFDKKLAAAAASVGLLHPAIASSSLSA